jgi:hypothetical protein
MVRRLDQVLGSYHGISFGDFMLLHYLNRAGRPPAPRLAERQGLTASGVTRTLLPLEKSAWSNASRIRAMPAWPMPPSPATGRELLLNATPAAEPRQRLAAQLSGRAIRQPDRCHDLIGGLPSVTLGSASAGASHVSSAPNQRAERCATSNGCCAAA